MLNFANKESKNVYFLFQKNSDNEVKDHISFKGVLFLLLTIKNRELGIHSEEIKNCRHIYVYKY